MPVIAAFAVPHPPLIIPEVGHGRERGIQATIDAYAEVGRRIAALEPDVIVISSPHTVMYADYLHIAPGAGARGTFAQFGAPQTGCSVDYDEQLVSEICRRADAADIPAGTLGERDRELDWGVLLPLHFIEAGYREQADNEHANTVATPRLRKLPHLPCPIVRLGISGLSPIVHYRLGQIIRDAADALGRRMVYVASGDLSHKLAEDGPYGFAPEGPAFDALTCNAFASGDFLKLLTCDPSLAERAAECGLRSFYIMAGALDRAPVHAELLSHEGPFGVGYGIAAFTPTGGAASDESRAFGEQYIAHHEHELKTLRAQESPWVALARFSLERFILEGRATDPARDLPATLAKRLPRELFSTRSGAFVSLKMDGQLRGCIGTISPTRATLAEEICANAISAGCHDPRFDAVSSDELGELVYDVDVLSTPERIPGLEALDPARYGVIVSTSDGRRGLLLPDLDGVDTVEKQLRIAAQKGHIDLAHDEVTLERFTVTRHL